jgi:hypothetical protein
VKTIRLLRSRTGLALVLLADLLVYASSPGPYDYTNASLEIALAAQEVFTEDWLDFEEVVGTAIGVDGAGHAVLKVYLAEPSSLELPRYMAGVEIVTEVTGPFTPLPALAAAPDPTTNYPRPVPIGVSTGHPDVTAGTIGARVTDGERVFALSNNHVFAANNGGREGDNLLQPGVADGGRDPDDSFGTLYDFEPLSFCRAGVCGLNRIDAALALTTPEDLGTETPEGGYGSPRPWSLEAEIGMAVQKYGRTTGHTVGEISGIHAILDVNYRTGTARFEDQIVISGAGFSAGGDSGSLVVTKGRLLADRRPVGLLFAGSGNTTIANPITHVLERFNVGLDGG